MSSREYKKEIMDDFSITGRRLEEALFELKIINRFLGGNSTSLEGLNFLLTECADYENVKILDAGIGGADNLLNFRKERKNIRIFGIDLNKGVCSFVRRNNPEIKVVYGNLQSPPFGDKSFDAVHFSLVLHHFGGNEIAKVIREFVRISRYGIVINDLQRNFAAYWGIKILTRLFSKSDMVKNDGPLSVRRGFKKKELIMILKNSGMSNYMIKRKWAFRWLIIIYS